MNLPQLNKEKIKTIEKLKTWSEFSSNLFKIKLQEKKPENNSLLEFSKKQLTNYNFPNHIKNI